MFHDSAFSQYLSYGATDQQTARDLRRLYDGLVVPGTIAAFQHQGTGGFVLTLSATVAGAPYVIDPRFPLFQQALPHPKKSHSALASVMGHNQLVRSSEPGAADFTPDLIRTIAENWVEFNESYQGSAGAKFEKYRKRLNEPVIVGDSKVPEYILAPYFVADGPTDPWWARSKELFDATVRAATTIDCIRVVGATSTGSLSQLMPEIEDAGVLIWVSGLNELESSPEDLSEYLSTISGAHERGVQPFALYGGFFAVLCGGAGLAGASHGIGYGEYRRWRELPRSGPPPSRYYLPAIHRYVSQEDAQQLWLLDPLLVDCGCAECDDRSPIELDYHELMKHSVECRTIEIARWSDLDAAEAASQLDDQYSDFSSAVDASAASKQQIRRFEGYTRHLPRWIAALTSHAAAS